MAKTFYADPTVACIYQGASDVIATPQLRLGDVFFHSSYKYWKTVTRGTKSFSIPGLSGSGTYGTSLISDILVIANPPGISAPALVFDANTNKPFVDVQFFSTINYTRSYTFLPLSSGLYLRQNLWCANGYSAPAIDVNIGYVFGVIT